MVTKIAIPVRNGKLSSHFAHCEEFAILIVEDGKIKNRFVLASPVHKPGVFPKYLTEQGCNVVIAGKIGRKAQDVFRENGIKLVVGAESAPVDDIISKYLKGQLITDLNMCDH